MNNGGRLSKRCLVLGRILERKPVLVRTAKSGYMRKLRPGSAIHGLVIAQ